MRGEPAVVSHHFQTPIEAPLPGAAVRRAVIGSPAKAGVFTILGDSLDVTPLFEVAVP